MDAAARAIRAAAKPVLLLGSPALTEQGLQAAGRLAAKGVRILIDTFAARQPRGAGRFAPDKMMYFGEMALADLAGVDLMVLVGTKTPVAFFAYPAMPSVLVPEGCEAGDAVAPCTRTPPARWRPWPMRSARREAIAAQTIDLPAAPTGDLSAYTIGDSIARWMPEHAVICDDAVTAGLPIYMQTRGARPHDWLSLTGGAIGQGIPLRHRRGGGARRTRKVLSLNGDGAAAYTLQGLWTIAREGLDVMTVVFANHAYRILNIELARTRVGRRRDRRRAACSTSATRGWTG